MDHLKEIKRLVRKALDDRTMPMPGQIVYLKPDPTVALFEAQQTIDHLSHALYQHAEENGRLQLLRRADYEKFRDREDRLLHDIRAIKIELHSAQQMVRDQEQQLRNLQLYCREQEQVSSNKHKIKAVISSISGHICSDYQHPVVSVDGDASGLTVYINRPSHMQ